VQRSKTAPKGTAAFLAATLAEDTDTNGKPEVHAHPRDLLALADGVDVIDYANSQSDARAVVVAAAVAVARYENGLSIESWPCRDCKRGEGGGPPQRRSTAAASRSARSRRRSSSSAAATCSALGGGGNVAAWSCQ
jgi:hypothetical protein